MFLSHWTSYFRHLCPVPWLVRFVVSSIRSVWLGKDMCWILLFLFFWAPAVSASSFNFQLWPFNINELTTWTVTLCEATHYWVWGLSGKADKSWERREFIVEVSLPGPTHTLPEHPLIQCEAPATRLNGWSGEVGVSHPKPFVYTSPAEIRLLLTKREKWIFYNRGVILTLIHRLGPPFF